MFLMNDHPAALDPKDSAGSHSSDGADAGGHDASPLNWLVPWLLALAGILITLALSG
jgi:hypothetical protein